MITKTGSFVLALLLMMTIAPVALAPQITPRDPNFHIVSALTANGMGWYQDIRVPMTLASVAGRIKSR